MHQKVKKAVFPVAGMGTRFLPATKANPKEMLPIVDKPLIQFAVEEAASAGIKEFIFVTSSSKRAIEDHFDSNYELEDKLSKNGNHALLRLVREVLPSGTTCTYVRQPDALGLGHAVLCAKAAVGEEPFAVLLADDLIDHPSQGCLAQMLALYEGTGHNVIAVEQIPLRESSRYGIVAVDNPAALTGQVNGIVEKPQPVDAPSNLGVVGRYILNPGIFTCLEQTYAGRGGEIQLTDAIARLLTSETMLAVQFAGQRYDCGTKLGYLQATIAYALKHPEVSAEFKAFLENL